VFFVTPVFAAIRLVSNFGERRDGSSVEI